MPEANKRLNAALPYIMNEGIFPLRNMRIVRIRLPNITRKQEGANRVSVSAEPDDKATHEEGICRSRVDPREKAEAADRGFGAAS